MGRTRMCDKGSGGGRKIIKRASFKKPLTEKEVISKKNGGEGDSSNCC